MKEKLKLGVDNKRLLGLNKGMKNENVNDESNKKMRTLKLSATEIAELQPTASQYASRRGMVLGGIEVTGEIIHEEVGRRAAQYFGGDARLDDAEPCDGVRFEGEKQTYERNIFAS